LTEATFSYSTNREEFYGAECSAEAAATLSVGEGQADPGQHIFVGENVRYEALRFAPNGDHIIEHMMDAAYDEADENAESWLADVTAEQKAELTTALHGAISDWIVRHGLQPNFFIVKNVREMIAPSSIDA